MKASTVVRGAAGFGLLALAGCIAPPPAANPVAQTYLSAHCAAGIYQCELAAAGPVGTPCACPGIGAPSYGSIR